MSVAATPAPAPARANLGGQAQTLPVALEIARRSLILITRLPSAFIPSIVFPIFLIVAFSGAFNGIVELPGFPTDRILNWFMPLSILQASAFAGVGIGVGTARDIETGFYDRFLTSPTSRSALLLGPAIAAFARSLLPFVAVLIVGVAGGARLTGGPLGLVALLVAASGTAVTFALWCMGIAFRTRSQRAAPIMQIGVFFTIFLATAQVPIASMTGWLQDVARVNPMTAVLRLARSGFLGEVTWEECWGGLLAITVAMALSAWWAARGLRKLIP
ncbi:MAG: ABC transporter permease [Acidimicrobiales bacterium]